VPQEASLPPDAGGKKTVTYSLESPVGERIADAVMRMLFLEGFTIEGSEALDEGDRAEDTGINPSLLWRDGIGPEGAAQGRPDNDTRENRQLGLQLLAALLCGGAPAVPPKTSSGARAAAPAGRRGGRAAPAPAAGGSAAADVPKPLISDPRPLAYLCSPETPVPCRGELLYSLVSSALSYDPHGYGVPYGGYFAGANEEAFAALCLQVLCLLLQDAADARDDGVPAVVAWRPQEECGGGSPAAAQGQPLSSRLRGAPHAFRDLLAGVASERELSFLVSGVIALFGTLTEERSTYLPSSMRLPAFLPELLVLVFHLASCSSFVQALDAQGEVSALIEGILHVSSQAPEHMNEDVLGLLAGSVLLRLTGHRQVCISLNEDFEGDAPDSLPDVEGSIGDIVALASLKQVGEHLASAGGSWVRHSLVEVHLCALDNISTFAEDLAMETCLRFFALLERCSKSLALAKQARPGVGIWLPRLLEAFMNVVQYQYGLNSNLVYGLMTRRSLVADLATSVARLRKLAEEEGTQRPDAHTPSEGRAGDQGADAGPPKVGPPNGGGRASPDTHWWTESEEFLRPLQQLLEAVVPQLEAEVEKRDISTPDEAKELLPRCALGLLPVPHAFVMRSLRDCRTTNRACEECLVACLREGPLAALWDTDGGGSSSTNDAAAAGQARARAASCERKPPEADRRPAGPRERSASRRRRSSVSRERSVSRGPGGGARPVLGNALAGADAAKGGAAGASTLMAQLEAAAAEGVDLVALAKHLQAQQAAAAGQPSGEAAAPSGEAAATAAAAAPEAEDAGAAAA